MKFRIACHKIGAIFWIICTLLLASFASPPAGHALFEPDFVIAPVPDFDLREQQIITPKVITAAQLEALNLIKVSVPNLQVRWSPLTGAPLRLYSATHTLTGPSIQPARDIAMNFLTQNIVLYDLSTEDVSEISYSRDYETRHNGVRHLTMQQQVAGINVFGGNIRINIDGEGRILNAGGEFLPGIHAGVNTTSPVIEADAARDLAITDAGMTNAKLIGAARLVIFPISLESARLAWDVIVEDDHSPNRYRTLVDAADGAILWRHNLTRYQHGEVYTSDSPVPDTPTGTSACTPPPFPGPYPACAEDRVDEDFDGRDFFPVGDDHYDWWNDSTGNSDTTTTKSNNAHAKEDQDNDNDDTEGFPTVTLSDFTFAIDLGEDPTREDATVQNQSSSIVNAFYWINRIHDIYYSLGFDEASGNFQSDNFGLGGSGGDPVQVDVQDSAKNCNAGYGPAPDGTSPRMTFHLCSNSAPRRDAGLENLVIIHEYTHGLSDRLVNFGPYDSQSGGLQDGLCDFMGLAITSEADDDLTQAYPRGQWFYNDVNGNRRQPYSTDLTVFTRSYGDLSDGARCLERVCSNNATLICNEDADCGAGNTCDSTACTVDADCQFPNTSVNQGRCYEPPWPAGEIWCNTLWNARANLVWKNGFAGGQTMMQLAVDALKTAPNNPDYLDMRDMILQADMVNNGGVNQCVLWNAFARMGMGDSATTTGDTDINPVEAFDVPAACIPDIGVDAELSFDNVCLGESPANQLRINNVGSGDLIVRGVTKVSGSSDITLSAVPETPLVIEPAGHVDFSVTCAPTACGSSSADIRIESDDPDQPVITLAYTCDTDSEDPTFLSEPSDIIIECDVSPDPAITGTPTVADNCDGSPDLSYTDSVTPGICPQASTILRTWTVADTCGNEISHEQTIEVVDTTGPEMTCAPDITIECDEPTDPSHTGIPVVDDNCDESPTVEFVDTEIPGSCPQERTIIRSWTVSDACGNSNGCTQTIEVVDTTPPVISCNAPGTIIPPDAPVSFTASATDNCDGSPVTEITGYDCFMLTKKGKRIDKTDSCVVEFSGDMITILDSGGVDDHIVWTTHATDGCGNSMDTTCETVVVNPVLP